MEADWSFVTKPKWLLSHLFVVGLLAFFVWAGFWQVGRLEEKKERNAEIESRTAQTAIGPDEALVLGEGEWNFRPAAVTGHFADPEMIRVANRSLDGVAGEWSIGVFESDDGRLILVNRGFIQRQAESSDPVEGSEIRGWYRDSEEADGVFSVDDDGVSVRAPRLNTEALGERYRAEVAPFWIQLESEAASAAASEPVDATASVIRVQPNPLALPLLNNGSHFSYAVQWFSFTALGAVAYLFALRKLARAKAIPEDPDPVD